MIKKALYTTILSCCIAFPLQAQPTPPQTNQSQSEKLQIQTSTIITAPPEYDHYVFSPLPPLAKQSQNILYIPATTPSLLITVTLIRVNYETKEITTQTLTVQTPPIPPINPINPIDPINPINPIKPTKYNLTKLTSQIAKHPLSSSLADAFQVNLNLINPADPNLTKITDPQVLLQNTASSYRSLIKDNQELRSFFQDKLIPHLKELNSKGTLTTIQDHEEAWQEIINGLRSKSKSN